MNAPRDDHTKSRLNGRWLIAVGLILALIAGLAGWLAGHAQYGSETSISDGDKRAIETVVRNYILENPEILPEAMENLQRRENLKKLAGVRSEAETPYPNAILGNPKGSVTLVEFMDFACGFCKRSVEDLKEVIANDPDLKVVVRELPILSEQSTEAARMALAAAEQGKYAAFHYAMFDAGRPDPGTIEAAARKAGLDMAKAKAAIANPRIDAEIERNLNLARQLGFNGTPSWIVGDELIAGAVGTEELTKAIEKARHAS